MSRVVAVVGGGAAGQTAALAALDTGAEVIVLERDAVCRGSTSLSAGLIPAAGSARQTAQGISDSPQRFAADMMAKSKQTSDPALVELMANQSGPTIDWLEDTHDLPFDVIDDFLYPGHSIHRMHAMPTRTGAELIDRLSSRASDQGAVVLTNAHVTRLIEGADRHIDGVEFERPDGTTEEITCDTVILASCGYGGHSELVRRHIPEMANALYFGHPGNRGDALIWGQGLGAQTRDLSGYQGHGSVAHPHGILISWAVITQGGIQVNSEGRRFWNEMQGYSEAAVAVLAQPDAIAYDIFDRRIATIAAQFEDFKQAKAAGAIFEAPDVADLAQAIDVPQTALAETLTGLYNTKDLFGRQFEPQEHLQPPYCAVRVTGSLFHTQGGLVVNDHACVHHRDGSLFPNLYAAGGAAAGVSGPNVEGYLSGNGLLTAVTLGRLAGQAAARL